MKKLTEKDICIVIATYNRAEDIDRTLSTLIKNKNIPGKIIVIDQSKDNKTKKIVEKFKKNLPIEYVFSKIPSSSIAKNKGINLAKKKFELILILDDDVDLFENYFKEALKEFNKRPNLKCLSGVDMRKNKIPSKLSTIWLRLFFLPYLKKNKVKVTGPYGNSIIANITKIIEDVEWIQGFNMFFRKKAFNNYSLQEIKGYNVIEDVDSSYRLFKKYGAGSLIITPKCKTYHRYSNIARYNERKRIYVNHEDHRYILYKYFPGLKNRIKFYWSILGIILGHLIRSLIKPTIQNRTYLKYNFNAIIYAYKNRNNIKKGIMREFLKKNLSMK